MKPSYGAIPPQRPVLKAEPKYTTVTLDGATQNIPIFENGPQTQKPLDRNYDNQPLGGSYDKYVTEIGITPRFGGLFNEIDNAVDPIALANNLFNSILEVKTDGGSRTLFNVPLALIADFNGLNVEHVPVIVSDDDPYAPNARTLNIKFGIAAKRPVWQPFFLEGDKQFEALLKQPAYFNKLAAMDFENQLGADNFPQLWFTFNVAKVNPDAESVDRPKGKPTGMAVRGNTILKFLYDERTIVQNQGSTEFFLDKPSGNDLVQNYKTNPFSLRGDTDIFGIGFLANQVAIRTAAGITPSLIREVLHNTIVEGYIDNGNRQVLEVPFGQLYDLNAVRTVRRTIHTAEEYGSQDEVLLLPSANVVMLDTPIVVPKGDRFELKLVHGKSDLLPTAAQWAAAGLPTFGFKTVLQAAVTREN